MQNYCVFGWLRERASDTHRNEWSSIANKITTGSADCLLSISTLDVPYREFWHFPEWRYVWSVCVCELTRWPLYTYCQCVGAISGLATKPSIYSSWSIHLKFLCCWRCACRESEGRERETNLWFRLVFTRLSIYSPHKNSLVHNGHCHMCSHLHMCSKNRQIKYRHFSSFTTLLHRVHFNLVFFSSNFSFYCSILI